MLKLIKLDSSYEKEYFDYISEWDDNDITPWSTRCGGLTFEEKLNYWKMFEKEETVPTNYVPDETYFLVEEGSKELIGAINIRKRLNDYLRKVGGHIGYGVRASKRGNGYAKKMLELGIKRCKELGINEVMISCDKDNIASKKTIISQGGILENEVVLEDGTKVLRFWIKL